MKLTVALLVVAMVGVVAGAVLIARWAVGVAIIADCVGLAALALMRQVPDPKPSDEPTVTTLEEMFRRGMNAK